MHRDPDLRTLAERIQPLLLKPLGPPLPGEDPSQPGDATTDDPARQPYTGLATGHSLLGLWIEG